MIKVCEHKTCCNFFSITNGRQKLKRFCSIICKHRNHDYYDSNPNLSILTYAGMLGLSGGELKDILQTDGSAIDKEEEAMAEEMFETEARTTRNYW